MSLWEPLMGPGRDVLLGPQASHFLSLGFSFLAHKMRLSPNTPQGALCARHCNQAGSP